MVLRYQPLKDIDNILDDIEDLPCKMWALEVEEKEKAPIDLSM